MSLPLQGKRILVTRAKEAGSQLAERLAAAGAEPIPLPSIEFEFLTGEAAEPLDDVLRCAADFDSVVFTSVRGVQAVEKRLEVLGSQVAEELSSRHLVAVGKITAAELAKTLRAPDLFPTEFSAAGIVAALGHVVGRRFLLLRADRAKRDLPEWLRAEGAEVDDVAAYRILSADEPAEEVLAGPVPDLLTFTSSSSVLNTHERLSRAGLERWFHEAPIACIGPITAQTVRELGFEVAVMAKQSTIEDLALAVVEFCDRSEISHA